MIRVIWICVILDSRQAEFRSRVMQADFRLEDGLIHYPSKRRSIDECYRTQERDKAV
jgi:hypothetical protein